MAADKRPNHAALRLHQTPPIQEINDITDVRYVDDDDNDISERDIGNTTDNEMMKTRYVDENMSNNERYADFENRDNEIQNRGYVDVNRSHDSISQHQLVGSRSNNITNTRYIDENTSTPSESNEGDQNIKKDKYTNPAKHSTKYYVRKQRNEDRYFDEDDDDDVELQEEEAYQRRMEQRIQQSLKDVKRMKTPTVDVINFSEKHIFADPADVEDRDNGQNLDYDSTVKQGEKTNAKEQERRDEMNSNHHYGYVREADNNAALIQVQTNRRPPFVAQGIPPEPVDYYGYLDLYQQQERVENGTANPAMGGEMHTGAKPSVDDAGVLYGQKRHQPNYVELNKRELHRKARQKKSYADLLSKRAALEQENVENIVAKIGQHPTRKQASNNKRSSASLPASSSQEPANFHAFHSNHMNADGSNLSTEVMWERRAKVLENILSTRNPSSGGDNQGRTSTMQPRLTNGSQLSRPTRLPPVNMSTQMQLDTAVQPIRTSFVDSDGKTVKHSFILFIRDVQVILEV